jgi:hypothetical protein
VPCMYVAGATLETESYKYFSGWRGFAEMVYFILFIHSFLFILEIKIHWYSICPSKLYSIEITIMIININLLEI